MPDLQARKAALRGELRRRRAAIAPSERRRRAARALRHLLRSPWFRGARHVAVYLSVGSELATQPLLRAVIRSGRRAWVPRVPAHGAMRFIELRPRMPLRANRYRIPQPAVSGPQRAVSRVDLIVLPLVGFDAQGRRLGAGGGFYDRALAQLRRPFRRPALVGYAYAAQEAAVIPSEPHDVRLHGVVTERGWRRFS